MTSRLLIVAEDALTAESLRQCVRAAANYTILGFLNTRRPCGLVVREAQPDIVLVDDPFATEQPLARVAEIRDALDHVKVVLLARDTGAGRLAAAREAGVHAVIARKVQGPTLGVLLREIAGGSVFHAFETPVERPVQTSLEGLTTREREVLCLVAAGLPNGRIAKELWVTEQTVKFHLSNVYRKLGVANRTAASRYAHLHGLLDEGVPGISPRERVPSPAAIAA
jgi:DNA-binding NarL/FixJ family response regulator